MLYWTTCTYQGKLTGIRKHYQLNKTFLRNENAFPSALGDSCDCAGYSPKKQQGVSWTPSEETRCLKMHICWKFAHDKEPWTHSITKVNGAKIIGEKKK